MLPSNFELTFVADNIVELTDALKLLHKGNSGRVDGYAVVDPGESDTKGRTPAIVFYAYGKPRTPGYTAWKMSKPESIAHFIYSWLDNLDEARFGPRYDGDGSSHRGWRLNAGYSVGGAGEYQKSDGEIALISLGDLYPEVDFYCFQFMVRPEWTFYAK